MTARPPPPPPPSLGRVPAYGTRVSRTYEPDDPDLTRKRVRPFRLDDLERIPSEQRALQAALVHALPEALFEPGFRAKIADLVRRYTTVDLDIWFDGYRTFETTRLRSLMPGATCLLVLGVPPRSEKLLLEIDLHFVYRVISELLGTKGAAIDIHRPLTEIEQGVFLFLVLKALALAQGQWSHPEQLAFRIEDVRNDIRSAADVLKPEKLWLCATWKLFYDLDVGCARLLIPDGFARGVCAVRPPRGSHLALRMRQRDRERLRPFLDTKVDAWIEIGSIELNRSDLERLEPEDIIILEDPKVEVHDGVVSGKATMRIGLGTKGALDGEVHVSESGEQIFRIESISIVETPGAHDPVDGHGDVENPEEVVAGFEDAYGQDEGYGDYDESDDGLSSRDDQDDEDYGLDDEDDGDDEEYEGYEDEEYEGYDEEGYEEGGEGYEEGGDEEGYEQGQEAYQEAAEGEGEGAQEEDNMGEVGALLGDIPMVCVVELGRVQLTADEVIRLRSGQLIELGRAPTDPVDLVVNGKLVAKGELVEIEGALGVKLLSLAKGDE